MLFDQVINDTPSEVENIQITLLKQAGQARRSRLMLSLSQSMFDLSLHNLQNTYPNLSESEQRIKFVELLYGEPVAVAFKKFLDRKNDPKF